MRTVEVEILEILSDISPMLIWLIVITALCLLNSCSIYSLFTKLIKLEKEKKEDRKIILEQMEYTNKLLENILTKQSQDFVNKELVNDIISKNMPVENERKEENKINVITNKFNQLKEWIRE